MKLHQEQASHLNTITAYSSSEIKINAIAYQTPLVLTPLSIYNDWISAEQASVSTLTPALFEQLLAEKPELVLLGTGSRLTFPHPKLYQCLTNAQIGVEVMDTAAACRTYNILMAEDRRVAAILLG